MKKLLSLGLVLAVLVSFAACGNNNAVINDKTDGKTVKTTPSATVDTAETFTDNTPYESIKSFDDFKTSLKESGYEITETETEDGLVVVDMKEPTVSDDSDGFSPVIPTIDSVKPTRPEKEAAIDNKTNVNEEPEKTETPEDTAAEPELPTEEPQKPTTPESEPEPIPTPMPEPEPEPEQEPEPQPEPEKTTEKEETKSAVSQYTYTSNQVHTSVATEERYLYSMLDNEMKEWYRIIDKAVKNIEPEASFNTNLSEEGRYNIYYLYMFDNPEIFYLSNTVCVCNNGDGTSKLAFSYSVGKGKGEYCGYGRGELTEELKNKIIAKKTVFNAEVEKIISTIPSYAPDVVKEKLIYDRILMDSFYNLSARWDGLADDNWTAYGIIVNKYGVCESYAEAFQTLCLAVGINCTGVIGQAGGGHKWNAVQLDGEWYMCDITFDDPIGGEQGAAYHYYFNLTSQRMTELSHDWSISNWPVPDCTGTKYSYSNYFGE